MIHLIANKLVENITLLPWVDVITGIVKPAKVIVAGATKTYPIAYNVNPDLCTQAELLAFVPDSKKTDILYFEDFGTNVTSEDSMGVGYQSNFRLVCWLNYKKLSPAMIEPSALVLSLHDMIPVNLGNFDGLIGVRVSVVNQLSNDVSVFSRYSYQEEKTQFVTYPYDYFALTLSAQYWVRPNCTIPPTKTEGVC